jgi:CelD/BcsL family acetyltransferase involved in cellulose biosynthesis
MQESAAAYEVRFLSVDVAMSVTMLESLRQDYARLCRVAGNSSPFSLFEWHHCWCGHFMNLDPAVTDELRIYVLRNDQADCVAIVPLVASSRRFGPLRIVSMDLLGADPSTTESRTPLIAPGYEHAAIRSLRRHLAEDSGWDWIRWGDVSAEFGRVLTARADLSVVPGAPGYLLELPSSWAEFHRGLRRNIRESLRHCYNSLRRDHHSFRFEIGTTPQDVRCGVDCFLDLHARRAAMRGTVEHPDHFAGKASREFLISVCARLAAIGAVRVFQLKVGAAVVAVRIGFVVGDCLNLYYSGFDPAWARYGVMTTALAESLKYAIDAQLRTVNLSRGTDTSKTRWGPRAVPYASALELRPRLSSRLAYRGYASAATGNGLNSWILRRLGKGRRAWI